jgi:3-oxoacyl-[acyl-carrier protein] reductase
VQSLAQELAPRIRVNLLSPGWVLTPMAAAELDPAGAARIASWIPNRRIGTVEDCAAGALFLCSELSGHLVGIDLPVSGGALLPIPAR